MRDAMLPGIMIVSYLVIIIWYCHHHPIHSISIPIAIPISSTLNLCTTGHRPVQVVVHLCVLARLGLHGAIVLLIQKVGIPIHISIFVSISISISAISTGIVSSFSAIGSCFIGLKFGHILLSQPYGDGDGDGNGHRLKMVKLFVFSIVLVSVGFLIVLLGMPINKVRHPIPIRIPIAIAIAIPIPIAIRILPIIFVSCRTCTA